jgi:hypothetical protein
MRHCFRIIFFQLTVATIVGCSATSPVAQKTANLFQGVKITTACCESKGAAIGNSRPLTDFRGMFDPATPHFDFGDGLAPFVVFAIDDAAKVIEIEAPAQSLPMIHGGDGVIRYLDAKLIFIDDNGLTVSGDVISEGQRSRVSASRAHFKYVRVPSTARKVVVTTDPKKNREHHVSQVKQAPEGRLTSKSTTYFAFGGIIPDGHKSASYGPVAVRVLPNE